MNKCIKTMDFSRITKQYDYLTPVRLWLSARDCDQAL